MGGLCSSTDREIRQLDKGFFGGRCPHPGVECLVGQLNKLLMHFGCESNNGLKLAQSFQLLLVELGVSNQPLQQSFAKYRGQVTWTWLVSLWEKCDKFGIKVTFGDVRLRPT